MDGVPSYLENVGPRNDAPNAPGNRMDCQRNLFGTFGSDTMAVYLRIKPFRLPTVSDQINKSCYKLERNRLIVSPKSNKNESTVFDFKVIFPPSVSQEVVYRTIMQPRIFELFKGHDSLIFSFGASNSGKSYTIQGTPKEPGLVPRALYSIFTEIGDKIDTCLDLAPHRSTAIYHPERTALKEKALFFKKLLKAKVKTTNPISYEGFDISQNIVTNDNVKYSVWISCLEVYNDLIYDLLESRLCKALGVHEANERTYIEGQKYIPVSTWYEALDVYKYAISLAQSSATALNSLSSKSHCIVGIKIIRWPETNPKAYNFISNMWLCDLAGTERSKKTGNTGASLKKATVMNSSLFVLNKCFDAIRENQLRSIKLIVPFRESKLTLLFKNFLLNPASVSIVTNISQDSSMLNETVQTLKIAAIATKTEFKDEVARRRRITQLFDLPQQNHPRPAHQSDPDEGTSSTRTTLLQRKEELLSKLAAVKLEKESFKRDNKLLEIENCRLKMWKEIRLEREAEEAKKQKAAQAHQNVKSGERRQRINELEEMIAQVEKDLVAVFTISEHVMSLEDIADEACARRNEVASAISSMKNDFEISDEVSDPAEICQLITNKCKEMKSLAQEEITRLEAELRNEAESK